MKIIQKGDLNRLLKVKQFTCKKCGCVFDATVKEYKVGSQYNEQYFYMNCPYCKNMVYRSVYDK